MEKLNEITEKISSKFTGITNARDEILQLQREVIRCASLSIRATHRGEFEKAKEILINADNMIDEKREIFSNYPELYYAGYFLDAMKELAEARITLALIKGEEIPDPDEIKCEYSSYVNGMGEAIGELRRYVLDKIRHESFDGGDEVLDRMEELYCVLTSLDFPDAITRGLRRTADIARSIIEKTRGDLTLNIAQKRLSEKIDSVVSITKETK